jgi:hypothetical protein
MTTPLGPSGGSVTAAITEAAPSVTGRAPICSAPGHVAVRPGHTALTRETLGIHQDTVVARQRLREYGLQAHLDGLNAFAFGRLHALKRARAERAEADFATTMWAAFRNKQLNRWTR